jgi:Transposase DDE domain
VRVCPPWPVRTCRRCRLHHPGPDRTRPPGPRHHPDGHDYIQVRFDKATCLACPDRPQCTTSATRPRALALLPTRELHEIQTRNRLDQQTDDWQQRYAIRAGIEATLSQNVRTCGLRRIRYRGLARTHVQHILTALACNLTRIADRIAEPTTTRRRSTRFHALCTATA